MKRIILTVFTDPMMGLSYESEPVLRRLETHYPGQFEFHNVMSGLVRDVFHFMNAHERQLPEKEGIALYCRRLASIYKSEEAIGGLPIHMDNFHLFDAEHRSSDPLNLAVKAAQLLDPMRAERYLYALRYRTIVNTEQTVCEEILVDTARMTGFDPDTFRSMLHDPKTSADFMHNLSMMRALNIYALPSYLLQYEDRSILIQSLADYDMFVEAITRLTNNTLAPSCTPASITSLLQLMQKHPLLSLQEIQAAYDLCDISEARALAIEANVRIHGDFCLLEREMPAWTF